MKKGILGILSLTLVLAFVISFALPSFAQEEEMKEMIEEETAPAIDIQSMEGSVFCVEIDDEGTLSMKEEWTMCKGSLVAIGADGKSYVISGSVEDTKTIMKQPDKKKTVSGIISGHERGWILAAASAEHPKAAVTSTEDITVKGTIVCLLPNYGAGNFKQVVATGPCGEYEQHLHVVHTSDGQVYALHGSEASIKKIESMSNRNEVELQGKVQGEQGAWVLFVQ
ncbi:hypothetical protein MYX76_04920 [Desulfobacterota bacterium AH_259_B03_O07]|nr:hypothetical protein [Desulfobacterota bacterium AH_259_B03_O07]